MAFFIHAAICAERWAIADTVQDVQKPFSGICRKRREVRPREGKLVP
jgi:hypothetical protein